MPLKVSVMSDAVIVAQYMGSPIYLRDVAKVTAGVDIQNFKTAKIDSLE